jgi:stage V sporulation protein AC
MNVSNKEYAELIKLRSPNTKLLPTCVKAFFIGGVICTIGQGFISYYTYLGFDKTDSGALTTMTLIFIAAVMTGLKLYDKLAKHAGAGSIVPITGFANAVVASALEFKSEGYIFGVGAKMFTIAGPVIVYGIAASAAYGLVYYIFGG